jgi:tRNA dimethylallyltransferase
MDLTATIALVKTRTRQFAKRQLTWFRSLSECREVLMSESKTPMEVADEILALERGAP